MKIANESMNNKFKIGDLVQSIYNKKYVGIILEFVNYYNSSQKCKILWADGYVGNWIGWISVDEIRFLN